MFAIAVLLSVCAQQAPAAPEPRSGPLVVVAELSEAAEGVLRIALSKRTGDVALVEFRHVEAEQLETWLRTQGAEAGEVLLGYPIALLERVASLIDLVPLRGELPSGVEAYDALPFPPLFFDPLVLVRTESALRITGEHRLSLTDLCGVDFQGALILHAPQAWNQSGVLLRALAGDRAGLAEETALLAGLDANIAPPFAESRAAVLTRVLNADAVAVGVTSQRVARVIQAQEPGLAITLPDGPVHGLLLGAGVVRPSIARAAPLMDTLADKDVTARIAVLDQVVALPQSIADAALPGWMVELRQRIAGDAYRLAAETAGAGAVVDWYLGEVAGEFARRSSRFSQYYDVLAIAAIVAFLIWLVRRPMADDPAS